MNSSIDSLNIVVPTRDFARGLQRFLTAWRDQCRKLNITTQFAIIDDGGAEPLNSTDADVQVIRNDAPTGLGNCIRQGVTAFGTDDPLLILVPDFGFRPTDLIDFVNALKDVDMAIGVRPGQTPPGWLCTWQRVAGWLRRWLFGIPELGTPPWHGWSVRRRRWSFRFCYGPKLQDPGVGIVLLRRSVWDRCPLQSAGNFAILELIAKANFLGATIAEIPLGKPNDMPIMKGRFEFHAVDERNVFRRPTFEKPNEPQIATVATETKTPG